MKAVFILIAGINLGCVVQNTMRFNFGSAADKTKDWVILSDNVMGGVTRSTLSYSENSMVLSGNISLANFGGFSSVKTGFGSYDLSEFKGVKIRCKASNQKFAFTLEDSRNWTLPNYKGDFGNLKDSTWEEIVIYFKDFREYQIGSPTGNKLAQGGVLH